MLTQENLQKIEELKTRYPTKKALILPVLWMIQEQNGWVSTESMRDIAALLDVPLEQVYGVASFYTMLNKKPIGKYYIQVCTNVSCQLMGAEKISEYICRKLRIRVGETASDGLFTVSEVECLGSCGTAPMMQVNDQYYENLTIAEIDKLLDKWSREVAK